MQGVLHKNLQIKVCETSHERKKFYYSYFCNGTEPPSSSFKKLQLVGRTFFNDSVMPWEMNPLGKKYSYN